MRPTYSPHAAAMGRSEMMSFGSYRVVRLVFKDPEDKRARTYELYKATKKLSGHASVLEAVDALLKRKAKDEDLD